MAIFLFFLSLSKNICKAASHQGFHYNYLFYSTNRQFYVEYYFITVISISQHVFIYF